MGTVKIVTDGTSSLTPEMGLEYGVHVVPLYVMFGEQTYVDGVDLSSAEFYRLLKENPQHPTTSQPTPEDFVQAYTAVWESMPEGEGNAIVSVHASLKLSATVNSARLAAEQLPEMDIRILDSQSISMGLGLMAIAAARAAKEGQSADEIVQLVEKLIQEVHVVFTVDTLEYLHKGGADWRCVGADRLAAQHQADPGLGWWTGRAAGKAAFATPCGPACPRVGCGRDREL